MVGNHNHLVLRQTPSHSREQVRGVWQYWELGKMSRVLFPEEAPLLSLVVLSQQPGASGALWTSQVPWGESAEPCLGSVLGFLPHPLTSLCFGLSLPF